MSKGASLRDRAGHEQSQQAVSADPVAIPSAMSTAEVQIGNVVLRVHQLDNGQRVIDEQSIGAFLIAMEDGSLTLNEDDFAKLAEVAGK